MAKRERWTTQVIVSVRELTDAGNDTSKYHEVRQYNLPLDRLESVLSAIDLMEEMRGAKDCESPPDTFKCPRCGSSEHWEQDCNART